MKKLYILILLLLVLFGSFIIVVLSPKNYILNYNINKIKVTEEYQKENEGYFYTVNYQNRDFPLFINQKYIRKRKHIKKIVPTEVDKEICLAVTIINKEYNVCSNDKSLTDVNSTSKDMLKVLGITPEEETQLGTYQNITIFDKEETYLIWNYKGFYQPISKNTNLEKVFQKDNYQNSLTYQINNLLLFPDYDSEYYFTKIYVYDTNKETLTSIKSDYEISYESFFLGYHKNKVYLVDKKHRFEYEIDLKKSKINIVSEDNTCKILENNEWKNVSLTKVINEELVFSNKQFYNYYVDNNKLYLSINNYNILISNKKIKQIVKIDNNKVYYLSEDKLYSYEYLGKEKTLLKYPEWNFNYSNHIFIFN